MTTSEEGLETRNIHLGTIKIQLLQIPLAYGFQHEQNGLCMVSVKMHFELVKNNTMGKQLQEIRTEVIIKASTSRIWKILMEFDKYPEWNPFIKSINGHPKTGNKISARLEAPDTFGMTINPRIVSIVNEKEFRWLGHLLIPGLFDGEHIFELLDNKNGTTTFIQREKFRGILIPIFKKMLNNNTRRGFASMNEQLKIKAEKQ